MAEKRYVNLALVYGVLAMGFGVFYREFTKLQHFSERTSLSVIHTHYFMLGMLFFLLLAAAERAFAFSGGRTGKLLAVYQAGLNVTVLGFLLRGVGQVLRLPLSWGLDASISGVAGIGHILLGVSLVMLLLELRKRAGAGA